ncbi:MAG: aldo/keto reductase family protein [Firmicutes bacterium]|nr:aldo/keto reductase family protein [Bacillota bacterium]
MEYRRVGRTGLKVSAIALGSWLTLGQAVDDDTAAESIHAAFDLGINYFDTANVYQGGVAERVLGKALKGLPRSAYVLATKAFWPVGDGPNDRGLSRKHLFEQVHQSLRRLGTDYVDIFFCHRYDPETPLEETLRALEDLVRQGKVLYPGVSEWTADQMAQALRLAEARGWDRIAVDQPIYNMLRRDLEREILPLARREGLGLVVFSPLAQGVLTGKYRAGEPAPAGSRGADPRLSRLVQEQLTPEVHAKVQALSNLAAEMGVPMAQLALAWAIRDPAVNSAITGATSVEQVRMNAAAADLRLDASTLSRIDAILAGGAEPAA